MAEKKVWLITGCDSGMGKAIAETVLEHGDKVIVTARDAANVAALCEQFPTTAFPFELDVTKPDDIRHVVAQAESAAGPIDVLVNNAGHGLLGAVEETSPQEYRPMFEVNFFGLVETTRAVLPGMRQRRRGHIFCTSSSGGYASSPGSALYGASKFAAEGFAHGLAQEIATFGIKVTIIEPGSFRTQFAGSSMRKTKQSIDEYKNTPAAAMLERMAQRDGKQPNDPKRLAKVLMKIVAEPAPPLRLPLGEDSIDRLEKKAADTAAEFRKWRSLALSVAFDVKQ